MTGNIWSRCFYFPSFFSLSMFNLSCSVVSFHSFTNAYVHFYVNGNSPTKSKLFCIVIVIQCYTEIEYYRIHMHRCLKYSPSLFSNYFAMAERKKIWSRKNLVTFSALWARFEPFNTVHIYEEFFTHSNYSSFFLSFVLLVCRSFFFQRNKYLYMLFSFSIISVVDVLWSYGLLFFYACGIKL